MSIPRLHELVCKATKKFHPETDADTVKTVLFIMHSLLSLFFSPYVHLQHVVRGNKSFTTTTTTSTTTTTTSLHALL